MQNSYRDVRPIIVAEHASARFGGEAILPLHYFRFLRRRGVEAWLVVHDRTKAELSVTFADDKDRIFYVPDTRLHLQAERISMRYPGVISDATAGLAMHTVTQAMQRRIVRKLAADVSATIVHEPIPVSPRAPSLMRKVGVPVVIGPMNGGMTYPPGFPELQNRRDGRFIAVARGGAALVNRVVAGKRDASALLVANKRTRDALPEGVCPRVLELVENGVDLAVFHATKREKTPRARPRFAFVGRLVAWKAVDLLLEAFARARHEVDLDLSILGDGDVRSELEAHARRLGLEDRVKFHGFLSQQECAAHLADADALVLPSLYECGGAVVLEAMAVGLPVIATRWGGPMDYVTPETGILVDPSDRAGFVDGLRRALVTLAGSADLRKRMGRSGHERVEKLFDWDRKIDRIIEVYRQVQASPDPRVPFTGVLAEGYVARTDRPSSAPELGAVERTGRIAREDALHLDGAERGEVDQVL